MSECKKIIDFHYHKDKEYKPKTFIAITFLGSYTKTPPRMTGIQVRSLQQLGQMLPLKRLLEKSFRKKLESF